MRARLAVAAILVAAFAHAAATQPNISGALFRLWDGTDTAQVTGTNGGSLQVECAAGCSSAVTPATFVVHCDRIAPAQNKYMCTLFNTSSTRKAVIHRIVAEWNAFTAVTGVVHDMYYARISARTAGTSITIRPNETNDTLSAGISADTNSTSVTESFVWHRFVGSSEESPVTATSINTYGEYQSTILFEKLEGTKGLVLRQNEGVSIRTLTNSTVGVMSFRIVFTDEAQ